MELYLFEPQLCRNGSHYLNYVLDICNAAKKHGLPSRVFGDSAIDSTARQAIERNGITLTRLFPSALISRIKVRAIVWPVMALVYAWFLVRHSRNITEKQIFCTISGTLEYLSGISLAILIGLFKSKVIVQMYYWETREHISATPRLIRLYRYISEWLVRRAIDKGNLILAAQGQEVAAHISRRLNRTVPSLPYAIDWSQYFLRKSSPSPLQIGFLGVMRAEKGFRQFVEAMEKYSADIAIIVQVQLPPAHPEPNAFKLIQRLEKHHSCRIIKGELTIREYRKLLAEIDIAVLPYRPEEFSNRTSNLFSECVGLGKLVVTPRATLMGEILETKKIGAVYAPYTADALCDAIGQAVSNYDALAIQARKMADCWCRENSADSFIKTISHLAGS